MKKVEYTGCRNIGHSVPKEYMVRGKYMYEDKRLFGEILETLTNPKADVYKVRRISKNKYLNGVVVLLTVHHPQQ